MNKQQADEMVNAILPDLEKSLAPQQDPHLGAYAAPVFGGLTRPNLGLILRKAAPFFFRWALGKYGPVLRMILDKADNALDVALGDREIDSLKELYDLLKDGK
jgi:hypothetical protein